MKYIKEYYSEEYEIKYEKWKKGGYSVGHDSYNLYKNGELVAAISNDINNKNKVLINHIENFSNEKGLGIKLIFMLLDKGVVIETGKDNYNSISKYAYYMNKKIIEIINNSNGKYKYTNIGIANNKGKENEKSYKEVSGKETKSDNYHYRFEKC